MNWHTPKSRGFAFGLALAVGIGLAGPASALIYTYDNTTSAAIPNAGSTTACGTGGLAVTFSVPESYTVSTIAVALNVSHLTRGELQAILFSPSGTSVTLFSNSGDTNDNYDIQMSTNGGALSDGDIDPTTEPYFNRRVAVAGINFYTGSATGTWTLRICDRTANGTNGTFNRARLILDSGVTPASFCTSTVSFDWGSNGNAVVFTNNTVNGITTTQGTITDLGGTGAVAGGTLGTPVVTRTSTNGNHTGYYSLSMDATALGGTQDNEAVGLISNLTFSPAIADLSFTFLDVDITNNAWEDQVEIIALDDAGARVPYTMAPVGGGTALLAGDMAEGNTSAATTSTAGNVDVTFSGSVATLTINYTQGLNPTTENVFMVVGISDFNFCSFDLGDAPDTYGTTLSANGARHVVGNRQLYLGTNPPDGETDGAPGAAATTDDTTQVGGVDDEDGVATFPNYAGGGASYTVSGTAVNLSTTTAGSLVGYIDWNRDGDFADANERSATVSVPANTTTPTAFNVTWATPPSNAGGTAATYARFRIAYVASEAQSPTGLATSGEVEDYPIAANVLPVTLSSFVAEPSRSGVTVTWTTETETSTVGYRVHGWDGKEWTLLTDKMVPSRALDSLSPQRYEIELDDAGYSSFALEDVDLAGVGTVHGPFAKQVAYGREPELQPIDWAGVHADLADLAAETGRSVLRAGSIPVRPGAGLAELAVDAEGLYRVTHEDLLAAGIDLTGFPVDKLALIQARSGKEVAMWVQAGKGAPGAFGPGSFVEFRGVPVGDSLYTGTRLYRLIASSGAPDRVKARDGSPGTGGPTTYEATAAVEKDLVYSFASPNGDPWFETPVLAQGGPSQVTVPIEIDALAGSTGRLQVDLWGVTNWPGDTPDHHVELWLNGTRLRDDRFDGLTARSYDLPLPKGLLQEGTNELTVRVVGDTGFAFDLVHLDRYAIVHPRRLEAQNGRLTFPLTGGPVEVEGLPSPDVTVFTRSGRFRLTGVAVEPSALGYRVRFTVPPLGAGASAAAATVDVVDASAFRRPGIQVPVGIPRDLLDAGGSRTADYLIISHPLFLNELGSLVAARQAQGYSVKVVDLFDLYRAYSGGEVDPQAIRSYLIDAVRVLKTRMVLLVGGDSYDYLDHLGTGSVSLLPTLYAQTDDLIRYSPADSLLADIDGDGVQDLALGRLPARTRTELRRLVDKTLQYPSTAKGAVFAADRSDARTFSSTSEDLALSMPAKWPVTRAYIDDVDLPTARQTLLDAMNQGPALVNFVGHSGPTVWTFEGLFSAADSATLTNGGSPSVVVQWGCWNTYHVSPEYDTLAHRLLLDGPQGAAAVVGSSTLTKESSDSRLGPALIQRLVGSGMTLGDAIVLAKKVIARDGGDLRDVLVGWTLLGDPALTVDR